MHLNIKEILDIALEVDKMNLDYSFEGCEICTESIQKAIYLLNEMKKINNSAIENLYQDLIININSNNDVFDFLNQSNLTREGPQKVKIDSAKIIKNFEFITINVWSIIFVILFSIFIILNIIFTNRIKVENLEDQLNDKNKQVTIIAPTYESYRALKELEKKYGQLATIRLKNGEEYIGAFFTDNDNLVLITIKGRFIISASSVRIIMPYIIKE